MCDKAHIDPCATDQRVDIVRIEIESAVEVRARLVEKLDGQAFVEEAQPDEIMVHRIRVGRAPGAARFGGASSCPSRLARRETISSCMSKRSATGLSNRSAQR